MLRGLVAGFGSSPQSRDFVCVCVCSFELIRVLFTSGGGQVDGTFSKFPFILSSALLIYYLGDTLTTKTCSSLHRRSIKGAGYHWRLYVTAPQELRISL